MKMIVGSTAFLDGLIYGDGDIFFNCHYWVTNDFSGKQIRIQVTHSIFKSYQKTVYTVSRYDDDDRPIQGSMYSGVGVM